MTNENMAKELTTDQKFDKALIIISKYGIKITTIANIIGVKNATARDKLNNTNYNKFLDHQKVLILDYLDNFRKDLVGINL